MNTSIPKKIKRTVHLLLAILNKQDAQHKRTYRERGSKREIVKRIISEIMKQLCIEKGKKKKKTRKAMKHEQKGTKPNNPCSFALQADE